MMNHDHRYQHRPWSVAAIQWKGDNFNEVISFLRRYVGHDDLTITHEVSYSVDKSTRTTSIVFATSSEVLTIHMNAWLVVPIADGAHTDLMPHSHWMPVVLDDVEFTTRYAHSR